MKKENSILVTAIDEIGDWPPSEQDIADGMLELVKAGVQEFHVEDYDPEFYRKQHLSRCQPWKRKKKGRS